MREDVKKIKMMTNSGEAREFRKEGMFFFWFLQLAEELWTEKGSNSIYYHYKCWIYQRFSGIRDRLNLNLICKTRWTRVRSGLFISVLGKLSWFRLTGLITMVLLM